MLYRILALVGLLGVAGAAPTGEQRLPPRVDLGTEFGKLGIVPRVQGERDTCSLFAVTGIAEFEVARAHPRAPRPLSEEFLTWAANEASGLSGDQAMFFEAIQGLNTFGISSARRMPYETTGDAGRRPSKKALAEARKLSQRWRIHWIKRWDVGRGLGDEELVAIKNALANGHPVACGLRWPKALTGSSLLEVPGPAEVRDGHSIVLTGYEDDAEHEGRGKFRFRNSSGPSWGENGYGEMSYAYARAYANDALWVQLGASGSERPVERFEAESMTVLARQKCETMPQGMDRWGGGMWSRGEQLLGRAEEGGSVELGSTVRSPDFDLYSGRVSPAGSLELGERELTAGAHTMRFSVVGRNAASTTFFFGIDAVDLLPGTDKR